MERRSFIKMGTVIAASASQFDAYAGTLHPKEPVILNDQINFTGDGIPLSPKEYGELLIKLADEGKIRPDNYSIGGVVEEMENKFAKLLGKESAVFMPTGTLANHIAIRHLAGNNRKVILQEQSHFYNDSGDCAQTLSGLSLIPKGDKAVEFTLDEVMDVVNGAKGGRVQTNVGVISIESPVRRQNDRMFSYENMKAISAYAKANNIKMHLDGARLFKLPAHTNIPLTGYAALFDTVYISTWKFFNAPSGAVIAGTKEFTQNLFHERRMFGAGLPVAWPFAAISSHFADSFLDDYKKAWTNAEKIFTILQKDERFKIVKYDNGSHILRLNVSGTNLTNFRTALGKKNIQLSGASQNGFALKINLSINRNTPENIAGSFMEALKEA